MPADAMAQATTTRGVQAVGDTFCIPALHFSFI
jgi:hypothetical protein